MKQVILVRNDLKLPKGKLSAQVAHASTEATLKGTKEKVSLWRSDGMKKVVLKVENKSELMKFKNLAQDSSITTALITDAGKTVVEPGTITCLAIGPDEEEKIDSITGDLKMM